MSFKKQDTVRQAMPAPVEGKVAAAVYDADRGVFKYLVEWEDANGAHSRWFDDSELEAKDEQ